MIYWVSPLNASEEPNGAVGDFITIGGKNFGTATGTVIFMGDPAISTDDKTAPFPDTVNSL